MSIDAKFDTDFENVYLFYGMGPEIGSFLLINRNPVKKKYTFSESASNSASIDMQHDIL